MWSCQTSITHLRQPCDCLELARRNGVTMLTLPSHCSHWINLSLGPSNHTTMQLVTSGLWKKRNQCRQQIASLGGRSCPLAFTPSNITPGFAASGTQLTNADIFHDTRVYCIFSHGSPSTCWRCSCNDCCCCSSKSVTVSERAVCYGTSVHNRLFSAIQ